ncbi:MAG: hypothetical protein IKH25_06020 [Muribaculaceae bacterium]|nr:hypothetical protein [Muribaculaceae bacterium]
MTDFLVYIHPVDKEMLLLAVKFIGFAIVGVILAAIWHFLRNLIGATIRFLVLRFLKKEKVKFSEILWGKTDSDLPEDPEAYSVDIKQWNDDNDKQNEKYGRRFFYALIAALVLAFLVMQIVESQRQRTYFEMREHPHSTNPDIQEVVVATPQETPDSIR